MDRKVMKPWQIILAVGLLSMSSVSNAQNTAASIVTEAQNALLKTHLAKVNHALEAADEMSIRYQNQNKNETKDVPLKHATKEQYLQYKKMRDDGAHAMEAADEMAQRYQREHASQAK